MSRMLPDLRINHDEVFVMRYQVFTSVCNPVRIRLPGFEDLLALFGDDASRFSSDMLLSEFDHFVLRTKLLLFWLVVRHVRSTCGRKLSETR